MRMGTGLVLVSTLVAFGLGVGHAHEEHAGKEHAGQEHAGQAMAPQAQPATGEQTLTGEVVDLFCYLSHGEKGRGPDHAECAKKCILEGLPVAIKVGDQLYLATMMDHSPANQRLAELAAKQVTVKGQVMERDGQHLIAISSIEEK